MRRVTTFAEARDLAEGTVGLVPTMGFLHEGHLSLVQQAARECRTVVLSIFVNPLQFDDPADLGRYPRSPERDAALAEQAGADVLFAPDADEVCPEEPVTRVVVSGLTEQLEGAYRPGHFEGVATVVAKFLAGLQPDRAYFGRKDGQQLAVVRRMSLDLSLPVEIVGRPTVREADGLALSSRNIHLPDTDREAALTVSAGLMAAADAVDDGERDPFFLTGIALEPVMRHPGAAPEYGALASQEDVSLLERLDRPAFLAVAARVGEVRLIDNIHIDPAGDGFVADRGSRLPGESVLYGRAG